MSALLELDGVEARYGPVQALRGITLEVAEGEVVAVLGANGVGKTTLNRTLSGIVRASAGSIAFDGTRIERAAPPEIVRAGLIHVPEGRRIFPNLTVRENLELGAYARARANRAANLERAFTIFPRLRERTAQLEAVQEELREQADRDALTGLHNRRYLMARFDQLAEEAGAGGSATRFGAAAS